MIVFMQSTIDYMFRVDPKLLEGLEIYGVPEMWELPDKKIKYYTYKL